MHKSAIRLFFVSILLGVVILSTALVAKPSELELEKVPVPSPITPPEPNNEFAKAKGGILFCGIVVIGIPLDIEES